MSGSWPFVRSAHALPPRLLFPLPRPSPLFSCPACSPFPSAREFKVLLLRSRNDERGRSAYKQSHESFFRALRAPVATAFHALAPAGRGTEVESSRVIEATHLHLLHARRVHIAPLSASTLVYSRHVRVLDSPRLFRRRGVVAHHGGGARCVASGVGLFHLAPVTRGLNWWLHTDSSSTLSCRRFLVLAGLSRTARRRLPAATAHVVRRAVGGSARVVFIIGAPSNRASALF